MVRLLASDSLHNLDNRAYLWSGLYPLLFLAGVFVIGICATMNIAFQVIMICRPPLFDNEVAEEVVPFLLVHFKVRLYLYRLEGFVLCFIFPFCTDYAAVTIGKSSYHSLVVIPLTPCPVGLYSNSEPPLATCIRPFYVCCPSVYFLQLQH